MTLIPRYWYCEPFDGGEPFQLPPRCLSAPTPECVGRVVVHDKYGEIHGEAVLMCALPWPRFRVFSFGHEVVLPQWMAESLERVEAGREASEHEWVCSGCGDKFTHRDFHYRVESIEIEGLPVRIFLTQWCRRHFRLSFQSKEERRQRGDQPRYGYREAKHRGPQSVVDGADRMT